MRFKGFPRGKNQRTFRYAIWNYTVVTFNLCPTAAPQDTPQTSRNFSLTSEQLRGLVELATTLLQLERRVEDLATELGFLNCAGESYSVRGTVYCVIVFPRGTQTTPM